MKLTLLIAILLLVSITFIFIGLSLASRKQPELGLVEQRLRLCPGTPNCVTSEQSDRNNHVEPFYFKGTGTAAWQAVQQAIRDTEGDIVSTQDIYLHARYITPLMRYVDDVELRLDRENNLIHIRSASRVGRSDFGTNRKRVERLRSSFMHKLGTNP